MSPEDLNSLVIKPALSMLPEDMQTPMARVMLLAIAGQESNMEHRIQQPFGPAKGFWQFEQGGGVAGVLNHSSTAALAVACCQRLSIAASPYVVHKAIEYNDILACVFARLLLWTVPEPLTGLDNPSKGWEHYIFGWRPGKPHPDRWQANWERACYFGVQ